MMSYLIGGISLLLIFSLLSTLLSLNRLFKKISTDVQPDDPAAEALIGLLQIRTAITLLLVFIAAGAVYYFYAQYDAKRKEYAQWKAAQLGQYDKQKVWTAPDFAMASQDENSDLIAYGHELIAHTSSYLGPEGSVKSVTNGMNCQNCHLSAGTKPFGNNYSAVYSTYPKFRERSGSMESISKRVNDCIERSLNGKALDTTSQEMKAIVAYIRWLGVGVPKGEKPKGAGLVELPFLDRPADPVKGEVVYRAKCQSCHGAEGEGKRGTEVDAYQYPPLWGAHSYNIGAGLFRLSRFAGYAKANMPFGASYDAPQLSDEEAWDVAAFVNSRPRPTKDLSKDWPKISGKPVDHPFGPYSDPFSEQQHKFGPFAEIKAFKK